MQNQHLTDIHGATMIGGHDLIVQAAIALSGGRTAWVGVRAELPSAFPGFSKTTCQGRLATPGLIDCHTLVVFGGNRAAEFEMRPKGASYEGVTRSLRLPVKLHAGQLSNPGGAKLAASYGALSADHIEYRDEEGAAALARSGATAVILPGAFNTPREKQVPPVDLLSKHCVPMAVATDCNPGPSPMTSLLFAMNVDCTLFRNTPEEAMRGVTANAALALGLDDCGTIEVGERADLAIWNIDHPAELACCIGFNPLHSRLYGNSF